MEIDGEITAAIRTIKGGVSALGGLPVFAGMLPYFAMASMATNIFQKIVELFDKDDAIVSGHDLDLHYKRLHARRLQSGRLVCVPGVASEDILGNYKLSTDNRLVSMQNDGTKYTDCSYFVLQINGQENRLYEDFDHFHNAAHLLSLTNRRTDLTQVTDTVVEAFRGLGDINLLREIEDLSVDTRINNPAAKQAAKERILALQKLMSPTLRQIYEPRIKELTG